jgi:hypothetical protein
LGLKTHDRLINEYPKGSYTQKHYCDKDWFIIILIEIRRRCSKQEEGFSKICRSIRGGFYC